MPTIRKTINRKLTPAERKRHQAIRDEVQDDMQAIKSRGRVAVETHDYLQQVMQELKAKRQDKGLSLSDVSSVCKIDKARLSRLENDPDANPTIDTLGRIAHAIGVELKIMVVDPAA
ncbi:MAG: helix-turn-helix transcriptional regulator [Phycisphaeraceae bacterium]|nr:helix-turn-helix transcriptional regulator [Phycisphaeraceae bacterium]